MRLTIALLIAVLATPALAQNSPGLRSTATAEPTKSEHGLPCDPLRLLPGCSTVAATASNTPSSTLSDVWQRILAAQAADLNYAKALADAAGTPGSKLRSQCLAALIVANTQATGATLKNPDGTPMTMPDPHVITTVEQVAELIDNLQATSPLISSCAAAAQAAGQNVQVFLGTLLGGVALKAVVP